MGPATALHPFPAQKDQDPPGPVFLWRPFSSKKGARPLRASAFQCAPLKRKRAQPFFGGPENGPQGSAQKVQSDPPRARQSWDPLSTLDGSRSMRRRRRPRCPQQGPEKGHKRLQAAASASPQKKPRNGPETCVLGHVRRSQHHSKRPLVGERKHEPANPSHHPFQNTTQQEAQPSGSARLAAGRAREAAFCEPRLAAGTKTGQEKTKGAQTGQKRAHSAGTSVSCPVGLKGTTTGPVRRCKTTAFWQGARATGDTQRDQNQPAAGQPQRPAHLREKVLAQPRREPKKR